MSRRPPGIGSNASGGGAPSGSAGGDLSGSYPNPTVANLNGVAAASYALLASPTFTGTPAAPTAAAATSTTQIATTAMVQAAIAAQVGAVGGFAKYVRRTADSSSLASQATPQADDTLLFSVGANDVWWVEAFLIFTAANGAGTATTADVSYGWSVPASGTMQWGYTVGANTFAGWGASTTAGSPLGLQSAASTPASGSAAATFGMTLQGVYAGGGTGGTVTLKWSQSVSDASTLVLKANSFLRLMRLA